MRAHQNRLIARAGAFTLVELLVVLSIVALLVALVLPVAAAVRRQSRELQCAANLHMLGVGSMVYAADFGGILPWEGYAEGDRPKRHLGRWSDAGTWFNAAQKYSGGLSYWEQLQLAEAGGPPIPHDGDRGLLICPSAGSVASTSSEDVEIITDEHYIRFYGLENDGETRVQKPTYWCYAYSTRLDNGIEDRDGGPRVCIRLTQIRRPSVTVYLFEKLMNPAEHNPRFTGSIAQQEAKWDHVSTRHRGGGNFLMVDGHVTWFRKSEFERPIGVSQNLPGRIMWDPGK